MAAIGRARRRRWPGSGCGTWSVLPSQDLSISKADEDKINHLIELRLEAKNNGDYQTADNIRDELSKMNVTIKDIGGKTEWEIL